MLAAHMGEAPRPIAELRADVPAPLARARDAVPREGSGRAAADRRAKSLRVLDTVTSGGGVPAMPPVLLGGRGMFRKALAIYAAAFVVVAVIAKAAIVGIGLPEWVFAGSLVVMALGLPVVLWTGYVQRVDAPRACSRRRRTRRAARRRRRTARSRRWRSRPRRT